MFDDFGGVRFSILLSFDAKAHQKVIFSWHGEMILPEFIDLGKHAEGAGFPSVRNSTADGT